MNAIRTAAAALIALVLAACASGPAPGYGPPYGPPPPPPPPAPPGEGPGGGGALLDWRAVITSEDRDRLDRLDDAWARALDQARRLEGSGDLASLGALIDPNAALPAPPPPPGDYRCRTIKLGSQSGGLGYVVYGWFDCLVERTPQGLRLIKLTGSQRQAGLLFPEDMRAMVFLGSLALGDEPRARSYGLNPERDFAGRLERIGQDRWRLVIPWPEYESVLNLIELVPAR